MKDVGSGRNKSDRISRSAIDDVYITTRYQVNSNRRDGITLADTALVEDLIVGAERPYEIQYVLRSPFLLVT